MEDDGTHVNIGISQSLNVRYDSVHPVSLGWSTVCVEFGS